MSLMVEKLAYLKKLCRLTTEQTALRTHIPVGTLNKIFSGQTKHPARSIWTKSPRCFACPPTTCWTTSCLPSAASARRQDEGLFCLSAEEAQLVLQYRRLNGDGRQILAAMASLLRVPTACCRHCVGEADLLLFRTRTGGDP